MNTHYLNLSSRNFLASSIRNWTKGKKDINNLWTLSVELHSNPFPEFEELELWKLVRVELESRRKSDKRDDLLSQVDHAVDCLENPENYQRTRTFTRILSYLN